MFELLRRYLPAFAADPGGASSPARFDSVEAAIGSYVEDGEREREQQQQNGQRQSGQQTNDITGDVDHPGDEYDPEDFIQDVDGQPQGGDQQLTEEELAAQAAAEGADQGDQGQPKPGTYAARNQQVRLSDGSTMTVDQLLQERQGHGDLGQRETVFRQEQERATQVRGHLEAIHNQMQQDRAFLASVAQALMPQKPDINLLHTDPTSYHVLLDAHNRASEIIRQVMAQHGNAEAQMGTLQNGDMEEFKANQNRQLLQRDKRFGDRAYWEGFWRDAFKYGPQAYGYTAEELRNGMLDHRQFLVLRDALAYRRSQVKLKAQTSQGRRQPNGQPAAQRVINGQQRPGNPATMQAKKARAEFEKAPSLKTAMLLNL